MTDSTLEPISPSRSRSVKVKRPALAFCSAVARAALRPILGREELAEAEQKARAGLLTLTDLDRLGEMGSSVLSVIFDISHPHDVALKFLGSTGYDSEI